MNNWIVDPCPDANGYWTIRIDDGSEHGDTEEQPIATVYDLKDAEQIVSVNNNYINFLKQLEKALS